MESLDDYLSALASGAPTPGGGSAAALTGAMAAALLAMGATITAGNPKFSERAASAAALAGRARGLCDSLGRARTADESAFSSVVAAQALPRSTNEEKRDRTVRLQSALQVASEAPLQTARESLAVLRESREVLALGNPHLASDVGCAAELAAAALAAAAYNVRANHPYMKDDALAGRQRDELRALETERDTLLAEVRAATA